MMRFFVAYKSILDYTSQDELKFSVYFGHVIQSTFKTRILHVVLLFFSIVPKIFKTNNEKNCLKIVK